MFQVLVCRPPRTRIKRATWPSVKQNHALEKKAHVCLAQAAAECFHDRRRFKFSHPRAHRIAPPPEALPEAPSDARFDFPASSSIKLPASQFHPLSLSHIFSPHQSLANPSAETDRASNLAAPSRPAERPNAGTANKRNWILIPSLQVRPGAPHATPLHGARGSLVAGRVETGIGYDACSLARLHFEGQ
ncbi:MAG: hypothetical protein MMC23_007537 [Stictis urceolatum]|nr:hypothetical protein [Stictis urceolata]